MADTIADVTINSDAYYDVNALSSVVVGTAIAIQNKGNHAVYVQIQVAQPSASSTDGVILYSKESLQIDAAANNVWAKAAHGFVRINVDLV